MHVAPGAARARAFRKLATLLRPGGRMMLSLRQGPSGDGRDLHPTDPAEVERLATDLGLAILRSDGPVADRLGRPASPGPPSSSSSRTTRPAPCRWSAA
jgi:hypothetical protein